MAAIDLRPEALLRLVRRLQREYGETSGANFALDEQLDEAHAEVERLTALLREKERVLAERAEVVAALVNRAQAAERDCELLRERLDPRRAGRFRRPRGANPD